MQCSLYVILFIQKQVRGHAMLSHQEVQGKCYLFIQVSEDQEILSLVRSMKPDLFIFEDSLTVVRTLHLYDLLHKNPQLEDVPALLLYETCAQKEIAQKMGERVMNILMAPYQPYELFNRIQEICLRSPSSMKGTSETEP